MSTPGEIAGGLVIPVIAGILNGSWNAAFSPAANLAVGKGDDVANKKFDLCHHHAWILFQFYAAIANIILCLFWAGGSARVSWIVATASTKSVALVSVFGILMGMGIALFGEACRIAGVGMGTNLTIGIIMILGTLLPLALNNEIATPSGGVIIAGLVVAALGLFLSMKSLKLRNQQEVELSRRYRENLENTKHVEEGDEMAVAGGDEEGGDAGSVNKNEKQTEEEAPPVPHSVFTKIVICALAAGLSSTLQFAFVFGGELINIASSSDGPGSTPESGYTAIIWLFVIPLSTIPNIMYAFFQARDVTINHLWLCPVSRHFKIFFAACLPWIGHINLYGVAANLLLPPNIAAAVAWPILMMTTVAWGMILSIYLGEWKDAPHEAQTKQKWGLGLMVVGVAVVMASVALDPE